MGGVGPGPDELIAEIFRQPAGRPVAGRDGLGVKAALALGHEQVPDDVLIELLEPLEQGLDPAAVVLGEQGPHLGGVGELIGEQAPQLVGPEDQRLQGGGSIGPEISEGPLLLVEPEQALVGVGGERV